MAEAKYPPWGPAWRAAPAASRPFGGARYLRELSPPLLLARVVVLRTVVYLVLLFVGVAAIPAGEAPTAAWFLVAVVSVWGGGAVVLVRWRVPAQFVRDREPAEAVTTLVSFLVALASLPATIGLLGVFIGGGPGPYAGGMMLSFALLTLASPSPGLVGSAQRRARRLGDPRDYHGAMLG